MLNNFFVSSFSHLNLSKAVCQTSSDWVAHSVKPLCLNVAGSGFESRWPMTGLQEVLWSAVAWTLLLFQMSDLSCAFVLNQKPMFVPFHLNFCSVLNFWNDMFILCTLCFCHFALPAMRRPTPLCFAGLAPALLLAAIFWTCFCLLKVDSICGQSLCNGQSLNSYRG